MDFFTFFCHVTVFVFILKGRFSLKYKSVGQTSTKYFTSGAEQALDGNHKTYSLTKNGWNQSLTVTFDKQMVFSWIFIRIDGGSYDIVVANTSDTSQNGSYCNEALLERVNFVYHENIPCNQEIEGDILKIIKRGFGWLKIFEITPIFCPPQSHGPSCVKCDSKCASCSPINGQCRTCTQKHYGNLCQYRCPRKCELCNNTEAYCLQCSGGNVAQNCKMSSDRNEGQHGEKSKKSYDILKSNVVVIALSLVSTIIVCVVFLSYFKIRKKNLNMKDKKTHLYSPIEILRKDRLGENSLNNDMVYNGDGFIEILYNRDLQVFNIKVSTQSTGNGYSTCSAYHQTDDINNDTVCTDSLSPSQEVAFDHVNDYLTVVECMRDEASGSHL